MDMHYSDTTLVEELANELGLQTRAVNVCLANGLYSLGAIRKFRNMHGDLMKLRNCGRLTRDELHDLLDRTANGNAPVQQMGPETLEQVVHLHFAALSVRARNALQAAAGDTSPEMMARLFKFSEIDFLKLRNVGKKTLAELEEFRDAITRGEATLPLHPPVLNDPRSIAFARYLEDPDLQQLQVDRFTDDGGHVRVFEMLLHALPFWEGHDRPFWKVMSAWSRRDTHLLSENELAALLGLQPMKVERALRSAKDAFGNYFRYLQKVIFADRLTPLEGSRPVQVVTTGSLASMEIHGAAIWAPRFAANVMAVLSKGRYEQVSWRRLSFTGRLYRTLDAEAPLLIEPEVVSRLVHVMAMLQPMATGRTSHVISADVPKILKCTTPKAQKVLDALLVILPVAWPHAWVEGKHVHFGPLKPKGTDEMLQKALEKLDRPAHASDLMAELECLYPGKKWSIETIRQAAMRGKPQVISFSRTCTYGLKKWEKEKPGIHGGTIRDIVEEYLNTKDRPVHISELLDHVLKFRSTNLRNVHTNLQMKNKGRFVFFPKGHVGLGNKQYMDLPEKWVSPVPPLKRKPSGERKTSKAKASSTGKINARTKIQRSKKERVSTPGKQTAAPKSTGTRTPPPSFFKPAFLQRFIGSTKDELIMHINERTKCGVVAVMQAVNSRVGQGVIVLDAKDRIRKVVG